MLLGYQSLRIISTAHFFHFSAGQNVRVSPNLSRSRSHRRCHNWLILNLIGLFKCSLSRLLRRLLFYPFYLFFWAYPKLLSLYSTVTLTRCLCSCWICNLLTYVRRARLFLSLFERGCLILWWLQVCKSINSQRHTPWSPWFVHQFRFHWLSSLYSSSLLLIQAKPMDVDYPASRLANHSARLACVCLSWGQKSVAWATASSSPRGCLWQIQMPEAARGLRKLKLPLDLPPTSSNLFVVSAFYFITRVSGKLSFAFCVLCLVKRGDLLSSFCLLAWQLPLHST